MSIDCAMKIALKRCGQFNFTYEVSRTHLCALLQYQFQTKLSKKNPQHRLMFNLCTSSESYLTLCICRTIVFLFIDFSFHFSVFLFLSVKFPYVYVYITTMCICFHFSSHFRMYFELVPSLGMRFILTALLSFARARAHTHTQTHTTTSFN